MSSSPGPDLPNHIDVIPSPRTPREPVVWTLLREHVPVTLLCDLLFDDGPPSREILTAEALADDVRRCHPDPLAAAHPAGRSTEPPEISISSA